MYALDANTDQGTDNVLLLLKMHSLVQPWSMVGWVLSALFVKMALDNDYSSPLFAVLLYIMRASLLRLFGKVRGHPESS